MTTIARYDWEDSEGTHKNDIQWDFATGGFAMCDGLEAYAQTLEAVIKTVRGELVTKRSYGVPYFSTIFASKVHVDEWAEAVKTVVSSLDFISSIDVFEYKYDDSRKVLTYKLGVTTTDGTPVEIAEELEG